MSIFLGLDCGGTSIRALVVDAGGNVLHEGKAGAGNWATTERNLIASHIGAAICGSPKVDYCCACMAGILTESDAEEAAELVATVTGGVVRVRPDYHAAVSADRSAGVVLIAGTGSVAASWFKGVIVKTGGGGAMFADDGSAFGVGRQVMRNLIYRPERVSDRQREYLEKRTSGRTCDEILASIYRSESPVSLVAELAGIVAEDYEEGNSNAINIVEMACHDLADIVGRHVTKYPPEREKWMVTGGLWRSSPIYLKRFRELAGNKGGNQIGLLSVEPVVGAVELAKVLKDEH